MTNIGFDGADVKLISGRSAFTQCVLYGCCFDGVTNSSAGAVSLYKTDVYRLDVCFFVHLFNQGLCQDVLTSAWYAE